MPKITKAQVDKDLRQRVFANLFGDDDSEMEFVKINDRRYGILLTDLNNVQRYVRLDAIVAEEREGMTAEELMETEKAVYQQKQDDKAEKAKAKAEKIAKDKAKREAEKKAKEEGEE